MTEQATLNENVSEKDLNLWNILQTVGKNYDWRPWPETRIFIEMDSACVGISKVIAMRSKIEPGHFCHFYSIVVEFMQ